MPSKNHIFVLFEEFGYDGKCPILAIIAESESEAIEKLGGKLQKYPRRTYAGQDLGTENGMPDEIVDIPEKILKKIKRKYEQEGGWDTVNKDSAFSICQLPILD